MTDLVTRHVTVGAVAVAWTEIGAGTPVLMIHGFPDIVTTFLPLAGRFRDRGYRCVPQDLARSPRSSLWPPRTTSPSSGAVAGMVSPDRAPPGDHLEAVIEFA